MTSLSDVAMASSSATAAEATVPIMLTTSLTEYAIPSGPYMVPVSWRRTHLSTLVNKLVASSSTGLTTVPFDFIIDSALLRTSLGEFLESSGLTAESTLAIEYVRSTLPPTRLAAFEHDDWVASVDCSRQALYMTASFDGSVRVFEPTDATNAVHTFSTVNKAAVQGGRNTALTKAKWTPEGDIVTGGMDGGVQMWSVQHDEGWRSARKWGGVAHNAPVADVDVAQGPAGVSVLSAGWDGIVALWDDVPSTTTADNNDDEDDSDDGAKRRKTASGAAKSTRGARAAGVKEPTVVLWHAAPAAHAATGAKNVFTSASRVSAVLFERTATGRDSNRAWSAGYNGLKGWDLSSGGTLHTSLSMPTSTAETRPITALAQLGPTALVAGATDRAMQIFDIRTDATTAALGVAITNAHRGAVDALSAHPTSTVMFASASSADSHVKVWDTRSSRKPLFVLGTAGAEGVLALDWSQDGQQLVAGGKDKRITVYRGTNIGV